MARLTDDAGKGGSLCGLEWCPNPLCHHAHEPDICAGINRGPYCPPTAKRKPISTSIYLQADAAAIVDARDTSRADDDEDEKARSKGLRSATINEIIERYAAMVETLTPEFSLLEWMLIVDALNGVWLRDLGRYRSGGWLYPELADACDVSIGDLARKHGLTDGALGNRYSPSVLDFLARVRTLTYAETVAVADVATRFWSDRTGKPHADVLVAAGAKIRA